MNPSNSFEQAAEAIKALQAASIDMRMSAEDLARFGDPDAMHEACYAAGSFFGAWGAGDWRSMNAFVTTSWASQYTDAPVQLSHRLGAVRLRSFELGDVHWESSSEILIEVGVRARGPGRKWIRGTYAASVMLEAGRWGVNPNSITRMT